MSVNHRPIVLLVACLLLSGCAERPDLAGPSGEPSAAPRPGTDGSEDPSRIPPRYHLGGHAPGVPHGAGVPVVPGKVVAKLMPGETWVDFDQAWGTRTERQLAGSGYAVVALPSPGADPWGFVVEMVASPECADAEPLYVTESPESQQGTVPFFEGDATPQTVQDQEALSRIGVPAAHAVATGAGITVAVLDTGVDATHPDLAGVVSPLGIDFVDGDNEPRDDAVGLDADGDGRLDEAAGHGTHVAGLVHAVAPAATILAIRVLDSEGNGSSATLAEGIRWAAHNGADIINLSLGMYADAHVVKEAIDDAIDLGIAVVAAAGNRGVLDDRHFPSRMSHVICVSATDALDLKASFSNYGENTRISAPGVGLVAPWRDHGYASWSGTSMATPLVAGAAALRLEVSPWMSPDALIDALESSARVTPPGYPWSNGMGAGLLRASHLLQP